MEKPIKIGIVAAVCILAVGGVVALIQGLAEKPAPIRPPPEMAPASVVMGKPLDPPGRQVVTPPPEGELGYLFYPDKPFIPVFPVLGDYEAFWGAVSRGEPTTAIMLRGKLVPVRTKVKVVRYTGESWVKLRVEEGTFAGVEGYTFGNVILARMPP